MHLRLRNSPPRAARWCLCGIGGLCLEPISRRYVHGYIYFAGSKVRRETRCP